jgi:transcription-repair coupling factor (superfamily II helicase)
VLCATSIIENGLDIARANTIIINRADRHGLSELYQLRGRVGRSNRRAYAYLLIPPEQQLTEVARRRLAALKEFSDLGAGFKIAALDLELRGAGNMLGGEQSGHIEAIGFELYTQMLEEAVGKLKGEGREERPQVTVNLGISLRIDESYIPEESQRLRMYKRIAGAETEASLTDVRAELEDRYGKLPESVLHLLGVGAIRLICERVGVAQIERKRIAGDEPKKTASQASPARMPGHSQTVQGRHWQTGTTPQPLAGRHGQPPHVASLQFSNRAALNRTENNAARAARETAALHPVNAKLAQAGKIASMRDMLFVTFSEKLHAAPSEAGKGINVRALMKLVARNARIGALLTPQGVLRWPLANGKPETVIDETCNLLTALEDSSNTV